MSFPKLGTSLVVAMAGASGSIYAARFLRALMELPGESWFVPSPAAIRVFREEYQTSVETGEQVLDFIREKWRPNSVHSFRLRKFEDVGADIASGSNVWEGMVIVPCSMKTVASIRAGITDNLIERAADVSLKERRKLILVPRETPYNRIHLENMLALHDAGAILAPASPGFYQVPKTLEELGDFMAGRIFRLLGKEIDLYPRWKPEGEI
ncbi:UbiX family flavin prenyltransferase [Leptospira wolffii]|uniref:Flavin prenyltransferase UbiX n=1 Tax=Leptospira wolffii TaxID=409998 RepID=A0ABV5BPH3_9LEPT|nr:UbiX family flavin prenyltransferase [Leptospira wolffii]EPG66925.1 polyprenyl P-hydroxybenzoate and phenylacrylic acid decarboxylase [Leptospira wolffii serovar Khorat str. Khorat-H2]TGK56656.1 UbiX family flavin prenyltransferase [Leptospira wolffii]TGK71762.1 UbiX family flavin prenyltransferase [Leptospira wolffii]TGK75381.1 UbiX family flavin prenyltransferase [Leptospira wolffii]TGL33129.1 UbiX family flavin prenyltransferase [Leptospira wolffii]